MAGSPRERRRRVFEIGACHSEGSDPAVFPSSEALCTIMSTLIALSASGHENGRCDARTVGHFLHRDLGFVAAVGDGRSQPDVSTISLFVDQRVPGVSAKLDRTCTRTWLVHRHFDRARLQHLGALAMPVSNISS